MAQKTFNLDSFPQGYYMSWFVTTQAAFAITVSLADSSGTYFSQTKQSVNISPPLAQGASTINGSSLQLTVNIPQSTGIINSINSYNITRADGSTVGFGFNISIEDGSDMDFNDVNISLVAWVTKG
jgi:hypothetical protein